MSAFVCRDAALTAVTGALECPPALVLVEGEAGIGKTRLMHECQQSGQLAGRTVLTVAFAPPLAESFPLGPVLDGVRRMRESIRGVGLSPLGGALQPLFPEWAGDLPQPPEPLEDPAATRHRIHRALDELIDRLGTEVLVLEDAHWADPATLDWLLRAGSSGRRARSVIVTYRRHDLPSGSPLWQVISRIQSGVSQVRVVLEPLDVAGVRRLVEGMFEAAKVSTAFALFLHDRTGGLPLAVEESLRLLQERGDIVREGGAWARRALAAIRVPPTVRDSVLERVGRLDPVAQAVLEAAAVLAEPADETLLATVAGIEPADGRSGVEAGLRTGLLGETAPGRVAFRHVLAAEAVEEAIPSLRRRRLHRRAGEALQHGDHPPLARLSRHFRDAGDTDAWARYAEEAADLALQSGDDHAAVTLLYELLTSVDHPAKRRARLARKLGDAAAGGAASLVDRAGLVMDALRQVLDDQDITIAERGEIRLLLGRLLRWYGDLEAADREIENAIPELEERPGLACRAMLNLGIAPSRDWPVERHLGWIERATAKIPEIESPAERLHASVVRVSGLLGLGLEEGWLAASELPDTGSTSSERRLILLSAADIGRFAIKWGRYAEATKRLDEVTELIQATGYRRVLSVARMGRAYVDWYTGQWAGLEDRLAELGEAEATEQASVRLEAREVQGLVELATGARGAAERRLSAVAEAWDRQAPLGQQAATAVGGLGRLRLADGALEEALRITGPVMARIAGKGVWLWATDVIPVHLEALVGAGELAQAEDLTEQLTDWVAGRNAPAPAAAGLVCQAIVAEAGGDRPAAVGLYAQAVDAWAALPRPYDELLALERQGRCLLAADEMDRGLAVLSEARRRLQDLGARWDAGRVSKLLREHGVEVPRHWRSGPRGWGDQLSPREREVLGLVAQGMTNREIGQAIFLSPKTVSCHLSSAMRKLGATTRTSAAMAAAQAGLLSLTPEVPVKLPAGRNF